ncbi:MAG: TIGR03619 family F420-dependent LLM class oxidoreductase [Armatimonadota bacterium]|nr:TIGR03619 family F420-dependent LLM class oxidoreductase [Armatimonadota bacterium]
MQFGIALPTHGPHARPAAIAQVAREAEQRGYATLWVLERQLRPTGSTMPASYAVAYDPLEVLAWVAAQTTRIRLGTSIIIAPLHAPVVIARRFATLDHLSGGRVIAGLGQGYAPEEFRTVGVPMRRRGRGFEEFIAAMRAAWGPDPVRFSGRVYQIPDAEIGPKPLQAGGPPVIVAAREPAAVARAGRIGDGFNPVAAAWENLQRAIDGFRAAAAATGRDASRLPVIVRANTTVSTSPQPDPRPPLSGSHAQVVEDLARLQSWSVAEVFFDMNRFGVAPLEQLRLMDRLRQALGG